MPLFKGPSRESASAGPVSSFRDEAERHRRWLASRTSAASASGEAAPLVLVVEDDDGTRAALHALLETSGYRVAATAYGEEAVRIAAELGPDVVLLDLVLPGSSGLDTVHCLKHRDGTATIPVVAMTGLWLGERSEVLASAGFDGALRKPYSGAELFAELERVLSRVQAERA